MDNTEREINELKSILRELKVLQRQLNRIRGPLAHTCNNRGNEHISFLPEDMIPVLREVARFIHDELEHAINSYEENESTTTSSSDGYDSTSSSPRDSDSDSDSSYSSSL